MVVIFGPVLQCLSQFKPRSNCHRFDRLLGCVAFHVCIMSGGDSSREGSPKTKGSKDQGIHTAQKTRVINYPFANGLESTGTPPISPGSLKSSAFKNAPWHTKAANPVNPPSVNTTFKPTGPLNTPSSQAWPRALCEYVDKCFQKCTSDEHRLFVEDSLKKLLNRCLLENSLNTIDWEKVPLISVASQEKVPDEKPTVMSARAHRFSSTATPTVAPPQIPKKEDSELSWNHAYIVGTSTSIEKDYLRLTTVPSLLFFRHPIHLQCGLCTF